MSVGNYGAVMAQLQGYIANVFVTDVDQGLSYFPQLIQLVASNAALTEANLRVTAPRLFDGTNDVDVEAATVRLLGFVAVNEESATNTLVIYDDNAVTEGTTVPRIKLSMAADTAYSVVIAGGMSLAALSWSVLDGDVLDNASTLAAANSVRVLFVYAE